MRTRIAAAALLALGIVSIASARQGREEPKPPADTKATLRPRVARLRAEVELLTMEHDSDVAVMKDLINGLRQAEMQEAIEAAGTPLIEDIKKAVGDQPGLALPKLTLPNGLTFDPEADARKQALVDRAAFRAVREIAGPLRARFLEKGAALNEKRMELADLEGRLSVAP